MSWGKTLETGHDQIQRSLCRHLSWPIGPNGIREIETSNRTGWYTIDLDW